RAVCSSFLQCDDNHTISRARPIDGGCCRVLQYLYGLDVSCVDTVEVLADHSVDDVQRSCTIRIVDRSATPHYYTGRGTGLSAQLLDSYTRHCTLKRRSHVAEHLALEDFIVHFGYRRREGLPALGSITNYDHFLETL